MLLGCSAARLLAAIPETNVRRRILTVIIAVCASGAFGCIDSSRVNDACNWNDSGHRPLDLTRSDDREHLRVDVEVADELSVRFGDAHGRHRPDLQRPFRSECTGALFDSIAATHSVSRAQIAVAERARVWWVDLLAVYLPMAIVAGLVMDMITRRVCRAFEPGERVAAAASVAVLVVIVSALALGATNFWSFNVEALRLRDGHLSNRAFLLPVVVHGWIGFLASVVLCGSVAALRFARTPLTGGAAGRFANLRKPAGVRVAAK